MTSFLLLLLSTCLGIDALWRWVLKSTKLRENPWKLFSVPISKTPLDRNYYNKDVIAEYLRQKYIKNYTFFASYDYQEQLSNYLNVSYRYKCTSSSYWTWPISGTVLRHNPDWNSTSNVQSAIWHRLVQPMGPVLELPIHRQSLFTASEGSRTTNCSGINVNG